MVGKMNAQQNERASALTVAPVFCQFVEDELLPAIGVEASRFWSGLESIIDDLTPLNRSLLEKRTEIQALINAWHEERAGAPWDQNEYTAFLREIGYLVPEGAPFEIETANVDREIAEVAGPQLVVPVSNARFALNAANARWGSLYDALYGTDAIPEDSGQEQGGEYNPARGAAVIRYRWMASATPRSTLTVSTTPTTEMSSWPRWAKALRWA